METGTRVPGALSAEVPAPLGWELSFRCRDLAPDCPHCRAQGRGSPLSSMLQTRRKGWAGAGMSAGSSTWPPRTHLKGAASRPGVQAGDAETRPPAACTGQEANGTHGSCSFSGVHLLSLSVLTCPWRSHGDQQARAKGHRAAGSALPWRGWAGPPSDIWPRGNSVPLSFVNGTHPHGHS